MKRRFGYTVASAVFAAILAQGSSARADRCCYRPACDRGVAIMSPLESPDPCDSPVGGEYRYTPYYRGYAIDRCCMPPLYGTYFTHGLSSPATSAVPGRRTMPVGRGDYGSFSGASQDESRLLHLGGFGAADGAPRPSRGDIIDRFQGSR